MPGFTSSNMYKQPNRRLGSRLLYMQLKKNMGEKVLPNFHFYGAEIKRCVGTIIRGTLKTHNSQLVTPISIKLQRSDGYD
jgi:hypothetical protein